MAATPGPSLPSRRVAARWAILKGAILKRQAEEMGSQAAFSVRAVATYNLFRLEPIQRGDESLAATAPPGLAGSWHRASSLAFPEASATYFHLQPQVSLQDMMGFNNTGNVCIWPSEELLAHLCLVHRDRFRAKTVLELGGGMASLAGILVAQQAQAKRVIVSDGNDKSIACLQASVKAACPAPLETRRLDWAQPADYAHLAEQVDILLCADCFFFTEVHEALLAVLTHTLAPGGEVWCTAPSRHGTREAFLQKAQSAGFHVKKATDWLDAAAQEALAAAQVQPTFSADLHLAEFYLLHRDS